MFCLKLYSLSAAGSKPKTNEPSPRARTVTTLAVSGFIVNAVFITKVFLSGSREGERLNDAGLLTKAYQLLNLLDKI